MSRSKIYLVLSVALFLAVAGWTAYKRIPAIQTTFEIKTDFGVMRGVLFNETPQHRDNFIKLANQKFYDGLLFHRCVPGFMAQGGDPDSKDAPLDKTLGQGGPGYTIPAEFVLGLWHYRGALCAARMGDALNPTKASSGSQFYVVQGGRAVTLDMLTRQEQYGKFRYSIEDQERYLREGGTPMLDNNYTVFGQVTEGLSVLDSINAQPTGPASRPVKDIKMYVTVGGFPWLSLVLFVLALLALFIAAAFVASKISFGKKSNETVATEEAEPLKPGSANYKPTKASKSGPSKKK